MKVSFISFRHLLSTLVLALLAAVCFIPAGCARIVPPTGGPKDTLPPVLIKSDPKDSALNNQNNKIVLSFNEFIQIDNAYQNVFINPVPKGVASIEAKLKTVTIKLKDTLQPNTTYSIDFGNALKDLNEGNIYKRFTYVFSTGSKLDDGYLTGRVLSAKTGKPDSSLIVILHTKADDSAVVKEDPRYVTRLDSMGRFRFRFIAPGTYSIYALKDAGGQKKYVQKTDLFAFYDRTVTVGQDRDSIRLYAYAEDPEKPTSGNKGPGGGPGGGGNKPPAGGPGGAKPSGGGQKKDKEEKPRLRVGTTLEGGTKLDLLSKLQIYFDKPLHKYDGTKFHLTDTLNNPIENYTLTQDTTFYKFTLDYKWRPDSAYRIIIEKSFAADSNGVTLLRNDTIRFQAKKESEYGSLTLRFHNFDLSKHPVLQLLQSDKVVDSIPVTSSQYTQQLYRPGDYDLRVLFDTNNNGTWDPGAFFGVRRQPEIVVPTRGRSKLSIRPSWDNGYDIDL